MANTYYFYFVFSSAFSIHLCWILFDVVWTVIYVRWMLRLAIYTSICYDTTCILLRSLSTFSSIIVLPMLWVVAFALMVLPTVDALLAIVSLLGYIWVVYLLTIASILDIACAAFWFNVCLAFSCIYYCFCKWFLFAAMKSLGGCFIL